MIEGVTLFGADSILKKQKIKCTSILGFTFYRLKNKDYNNGVKFAKDNGKRRYFVLLIEETKLFWSRLSIFTGLQCFRVEVAFRNPS